MGKTAFISRAFSQWHNHDIINLLSYSPQENYLALQDWLKVEGEIREDVAVFVEKLRKKLNYYHNDWNEAELAYQFIAPLIATVDFGGKNYGCFSERKLSAKIKNYKIEGTVDWLVAHGSYEPGVPYFFLHEYKRTHQRDGDPLGQLLAAMIAAQTLNDAKEPLYGAYVLGRNWNFVLLDGANYAVSDEYDALNVAALTQIWLVLTKTKGIIEQKLLFDEKNEAPPLN